MSHDLVYAFYFLTRHNLCSHLTKYPPADGPPPGGGSCATLPLPWGARRERHSFPTSVQVDPDLRPGEFVMRTLFAEFTVQAERKIESVMMEPLVGAREEGGGRLGGGAGPGRAWAQNDLVVGAP